MMPLLLGKQTGRLKVLCLGAHCDDIEIGAGGTLLAWIAQGLELDVFWCVLSGTPERADEARRSAHEFLETTRAKHVEVQDFRDGLFPSDEVELKRWFEKLKHRVNPDIVLTHREGDAHQDHRAVAKHTWHTFRNHMILEYEVPKWDGDMCQPNLYVPLPEQVLEKKIALLERHFESQRTKDWYDADLFRGLARLRGAECRAPERYAESFIAKKISIGAPNGSPVA